MATTSLSLGPHWQAFIRAQVDSDRYASASEVIRDALRGREGRTRQLEFLRADIADAEAGRFAPPGFLDDLLTEVDGLE